MTPTALDAGRDRSDRRPDHHRRGRHGRQGRHGRHAAALCALAALVAGAAACGERGDAPPIAEQPTRPAPGPGPGTAPVLQPGERGFALVQGGDTVAYEVYQLAADGIQGEIRQVDDRARVRYRGQVAADGQIRRLELEAFLDGELRPAHRAIAEVHRDSIRTEVHEEGQPPRTATIAAPADVQLYLSPSVGLLEMIVRRARAVGGDDVSFPVLAASTEAVPRLIHPAIRFLPGDSVQIFADEDRIHLAIDAENRVRGGGNPAAGARFVPIQ
jgi:hypothetical protein